MYTLIAMSLLASAPVPKMVSPPCVQVETVEVETSNAQMFHYSAGVVVWPIHYDAHSKGKRMLVGGYCWFPDGSYPGVNYRVQVAAGGLVGGNEQMEGFAVPIGEDGEWSWETTFFPWDDRENSDPRPQFPLIMRFRVEKVVREAAGDRWVPVTEDTRLHFRPIIDK